MAKMVSETRSGAARQADTSSVMVGAGSEAMVVMHPKAEPLNASDSPLAFVEIEIKRPEELVQLK